MSSGNAGGGKRYMTEMERALENGRRAGKNLAVEVDDSKGGRPIVSLRELAEAIPDPDPDLAPDSVQTPVQDSPDSPAPEEVVVHEEPTAPVQDFREVGLGSQSPYIRQAPKEPEAAPPPPPRFERPALTHCPRCGHYLEVKPSDPPTDRDKLAFVEASLGGRLYEKSYDLLGGKMRALFVASDHEGYAASQALADKKVIWGHYRTDNETVRGISLIRTALTLRELDGSSIRVFEPLALPGNINSGDELEAFDKRIAERAREVGSVFPLAQQAMLMFEDNYQTLLLRALDANFWTTSGEG